MLMFFVVSYDKSTHRKHYNFIQIEMFYLVVVNCLYLFGSWKFSINNKSSWKRGRNMFRSSFNRCLLDVLIKYRVNLCAMFIFLHLFQIVWESLVNTGSGTSLLELLIIQTWVLFGSFKPVTMKLNLVIPSLEYIELTSICSLKGWILDQNCCNRNKELDIQINYK